MYKIEFFWFNDKTSPHYKYKWSLRGFSISPDSGRTQINFHYLEFFCLYGRNFRIKFRHFKNAWNYLLFKI
jgi:hypothetical protein